MRQSGIEHALLHLIKMRASQINGCAYCIDMHSKDARAARGDASSGCTRWTRGARRRSTRRGERAALAWTEALTNVRDGHVPDAVLEEARAEFGEEELMNLTMAIVAINGWNRIAIAFAPSPASYEAPALTPRAAKSIRRVAQARRDRTVTGASSRRPGGSRRGRGRCCTWAGGRCRRACRTAPAAG